MQDTSLTEKKNCNLKTYFAIDYKQFFNKKEIKIAQNFDHRKTKTFCFRRENMRFRMQKKKMQITFS